MNATTIRKVKVELRLGVFGVFTCQGLISTRRKFVTSAKSEKENKANLDGETREERNIAGGCDGRQL